MTKSELIAAMDAHDAEGARLEKAMAELGLDAKALKTIRKAEKAAEKARATLAKLMGEPATKSDDADASTGAAKPQPEEVGVAAPAPKTIAEIEKKGGK